MRLKQNLLEGLSTFTSVVKSHNKATQPFIKNNQPTNTPTAKMMVVVIVNSCFAT